MRILTTINDLSLRPGPWINYMNNQATTPPFDHKSPSQQQTLPLNPNRLAQYVAQSSALIVTSCMIVVKVNSFRLNLSITYLKHVRFSIIQTFK